MTDADDDKTRIQNLPDNKAEADDHTRIAPAKQNEQDDKTRIAPRDAKQSPRQDDKTRIASPRVKQSAMQDDKTRIAPRDVKQSPKQGDKTRIAPHVSRDDKTRIAPKKPAADLQHDSGSDMSENDDSDKTRIASRPVPTADVTRYKPPSVQPENTAQSGISTEQTGRSNDTVSVPSVRNHSTAEQTRTVSTDSVLKERFILEDVLGSGGMGVVYKAKDLLKVEAQDRDPYVAIKVLSEEFKSHPEAFIALQRESRKSQRMAHPNIVNVFDFDKDGDIVFMTMEYMEGKPLDQLIRQYKSTGLPTDDIWNIVKGLCAALSHAHAQDVIHSDFKPGNVFVTNKGLAKVFDFGIARAVAKAEHFLDNPADKTVFDAGNLGALTPPYASLEMLEGQAPDVRDDIYALGCVIYEMFTGRHPFDKVPANEAERQNLRPKRIEGLSRRQWRAVEKALAFRREDRVDSIETLLHELTTRYKPAYALYTGLALLATLIVIAYTQFSREETTGISEEDIRNKVEYEVQLDFYMKSLDRLVASPDFSEIWEEQVWSEVSNIREMLKLADKWLDGSESRRHIAWQQKMERTIYTLYIDTIERYRKAGQYKRTKVLIENAYRYTSDTDELDKQKNLLAAAIERSRAAPVREEKPRTAVADKKPKVNTAKREFDVALDNVNRQLRCQSRLNMRNLDTAIKKLKSLDATRYRKLEPGFINSLVACITQVGKAFPERAEESKKYALRMFPSNRKIAAIKIVPRDPCDISIAGLGARGKRTICRDKIQGSGSGPALVVIPKSKSIKMFAIGKYELSVAELNRFCKTSSVCGEVSGRSADLPATNMTVNVANAYMKWLSKKTGRTYRLPTKNEWVYAAKAKRVSLDPNRNCRLNTRGIQKGQELVKATTGKQNGWGLVNYVGNAQEWVYDKGRKLVAIGGSYEVGMDECDITTIAGHSGKADMITGFRVLREIQVQ